MRSTMTRRRWLRAHSDVSAAVRLLALARTRAAWTDPLAFAKECKNSLEAGVDDLERYVVVQVVLAFHGLMPRAAVAPRLRACV